MPVLTSVRRIVGRDELWTVEGIATYPDAGDWFLLAILELEGERIAATTEYFGQTLEAPAWRAAHVERIDGRAAPPPLPPAADLRGAALSELTDGYAKAMAVRDFETLRRYRAPGWTTDWPQSGERIPNHEADVAIHADYPGYPTLNFHEPRRPGRGLGGHPDVHPDPRPRRGSRSSSSRASTITPTRGAGSSAASSTSATAGSSGRPTTGRSRSRRPPGARRSSNATTRSPRAAEAAPTRGRTLRDGFRG